VTSIARTFELAGIGTPRLQASFELCQQWHRVSDPATCVTIDRLPSQKRPYLHALYAFVKASDDIADEGDASVRTHAFSQWCAETFDDLTSGVSRHPVREALVHTVNMWQLDVRLLEEFLSATGADNAGVTDFATFDDLRQYLRGVTGTIAELTLPILEPLPSSVGAGQLMSLLGETSQLIDTFRDFSVDLQQGRCYVPLEELAHFGLSKEDLLGPGPTPQLDALVIHQLDRARQMLDGCAHVVPLVHPSSWPFLETAIVGIHAYLDEFSRMKSEVLWPATDLRPGPDPVPSPSSANQSAGGRRQPQGDRAPAYLAPRRHPSGDGPPSIPTSALPRHVAVIMDGNRRWARAHGRPQRSEYSAAYAASLELLDGALELGISHLTVFAFSTENWARPSEDVATLLEGVGGQIRRNLQRVYDQGVRVRWSGRRDRVPLRVREQIEQAERYTCQNDRLTLTVCLDYGGRAEILDAARRLATDTAAGLLDPNSTTEDTFRRYLYEPDMPDVDLLVRTSPEKRISNFLLWQLAYAELVFDDVLWPDFDRRHLWKAVEEFVRRDRRFGAGEPQSSTESDLMGAPAFTPETRTRRGRSSKSISARKAAKAYEVERRS
jgi:undecaprenyl diphosphate synthase